MQVLLLRTLPLLLLLLAPGSARAAAELFPLPPEIEANVRFWTRIYSESETSGGLIHDDWDMIVYEALDFPDDLGERARTQRIEAAKQKYRAILNRLASGRRTGLSADEARVLELFPDGVTNETLKRAAGRVRFQKGQADRFREGWVRAGQWMPFIRETFRSQGMPVELSALPHVESSFNPHAYSHVGAAGLWQFMPATGRHYLRVDDVLDERMDPERATVGASRLLRDNYRRLASWPLALTAYNHGAGGMERAARQVGSRDIGKIVRRYQSPSFGFASRNFYAEFLAALRIENAPQRYFAGLRRAEPIEYARFDTEHFYPISTLERALGVPRDILREHNLGLRPAVWSGNKHVPRGYSLRVPSHRLAVPLDAALASIGQSERFVEQRRDRTHKVSRGETLSQIASRHGIVMRELAAANGLRPPYPLRVGQVLKLPGAPAPEPAPVAPRADATPAAQQTADRAAPGASSPEDPALARSAASPIVGALDPALYAVGSDGRITIQAEETLGQIAEWLDLPQSRLRSLNSLRQQSTLVVGNSLQLEFSRVKPQLFEQRRLGHHRALQQAYFESHAVKGTTQHALRSGESIWQVASERYKIPLWLLHQYNPGLDWVNVQPGTTLAIPLLEERRD